MPPGIYDAVTFVIGFCSRSRPI